MPQVSLLIATLVPIIVAIGGFIGGYLFAEGRVAQTAIKVEAKQEVQHEKDTHETETEGSIFAADTAKPLSFPAPSFSLCPSPPRQVRAAPAARPKADAQAPDRAANPPEPARLWDSTAVVKSGRDADLQIAGLQAYITTVCRPQ